MLINIWIFGFFSRFFFRCLSLTKKNKGLVQLHSHTYDPYSTIPKSYEKIELEMQGPNLMPKADILA